MLVNKKIAITAVSAVAILAMPIAAMASYFPANRTTYTCSTPTTCVGANHIAFNSFTNNPVVGDERPFFAGSINGQNVQDLINVKDGDIVTLRAYVHNNADPNIMGASNAIARNVNVKVIVPTISTQDQNLVAFISATNAAPVTVNDTMNLHGDRAFTVAYVAGSANFEHKADGVNQTTDKVSDKVVTADGASLGDIRGCFQYSGYVTLKVKVSMPGTPVTTTGTPPVTPPTSVTPVTPPAALPETGAEMGLAGLAGTGAIGYAAVAYRRSRKALADKLRNRS